MISLVFYRRYETLAPIMEMLHKSDAALISQESDCGQRGNPALGELLDHLAEELAKEYVRLMKASGEREAGK